MNYPTGQDNFNNDSALNTIGMWKINCVSVRCIVGMFDACSCPHSRGYLSSYSKVDAILALAMCKVIAL